MRSVGPKVEQEAVEPEHARWRARIGAWILSFGALYWLIFAIGVAWTAWLMVRSPGVPVHDEVQHVLIARTAWDHPTNLLDQWGRPVNTLLYFLPSLGGLAAARIFSLGLSVITAIIATLIARELKGTRSHLWLVPLLFWFQPWVASLGYTALTEVPFGLFLIVATFLVIRKRYGAASVVVGCLPLIRHEGIVLVGAWGLWLIWQKLWREAVATGSPLALHGLLYWVFLKASPLAVFFAQRSASEIYGRGSWGHFLSPFAQGAGIPIVALGALGVVILVARRVQLWFFSYSFCISRSRP